MDAAHVEQVKPSGPSGASNVSQIPGFGGHLVDETLVAAEGEDQLTWYTAFLIFTAALAGIILGYDTGVVGVALPLVGNDLGHALSSSEQEIITAGTTIGAVFGASCLGSAADNLGRKWSLSLADFFFIVGAVIITASYSVPQIIVGRLVLGFGVGGATVIGPLYIAEVAPTAMRGRCIAMYCFCVPLGQVIADGIGAGIQTMKNGWRLLFALGIVPSMLQLILVEFMPESPRVLVLRGDYDQAKKVLRKVYSRASDTAVDLKFRIVEEYVAATTKIKGSRMDKIKILGQPMYLRSILSVSAIAGFAQLTGYNTLLYYAGNLFGLMGLSNPALGGLIPSGVNAFFLAIGMFSVDRVGRRGLFVSVVPIMLLGLAWCIVAFYYLCKPTGGLLDTSYQYDTTSVGVVIGGIVVYVAAYGASYSHLNWYGAEFLALEIRATGTAIATTATWVANLIVSVSYLTQLENLTPAGTYGLYLGFSVAGYIIGYFCYPETKGLSIDETYTLFENDFGVQKSREMRRDKLQAEKNAREAEMVVHKHDVRSADKRHVSHVEREQAFQRSMADKRTVSHVEMSNFVSGLERAQAAR